MNRRGFFRILGLGAVAATQAPQVAQALAARQVAAPVHHWPTRFTTIPGGLGVHTHTITTIADPGHSHHSSGCGCGCFGGQG